MSINTAVKPAKIEMESNNTVNINGRLGSNRNIKKDIKAIR